VLSVADVHANGIRFNVVRLGDGSDSRPTVVFIHGLNMDNLSSYYYTLAPGVSQDANVVLYDLRGHGRSERTTDRYALSDAVADLLGVLDAIGVHEPVYLVGNSYGGTIALAAAIGQPGRVAGVVLIEAIPIIAGWGDRIVARVEDLVADFDNPGVREWIAGSARRIRTMAVTCEELMTRSTLPDELRNAPEMTAAQLAGLECPMLGLYGEMSDVLDEAGVLAATVPRFRLQLLEGCSHSVLMEAPDELEVLIRDWLAGVVAQNGDGH
jgi:pimeloyl-ACP methyl ester carboxylesterase